jgi:Flp pilus assembly pilin Flp
MLRGEWVHFQLLTLALDLPVAIQMSSDCVCSGGKVSNLIQRMWSDDEGQDIAEYAVMLAVIVVIVVGTVSLIGKNANNIFSEIASSLNH